MCILRVIVQNACGKMTKNYAQQEKINHLQAFTVRFVFPSLAAVPTYKKTAAEALFVKACLEYESPPLQQFMIYYR